jgi:conserved oligomeric Golgi complex subunit 6
MSTQAFAMASYFPNPIELPTETSNAISPGANAAPRSTALSNRLTSVLSASYTDSDIRDALGTLDKRGIQNTAERRRQIRLDVQKEVLDCNGEIVADFGKVAEVRGTASLKTSLDLRTIDSN